MEPTTPGSFKFTFAASTPSPVSFQGVARDQKQQSSSSWTRRGRVQPSGRRRVSMPIPSTSSSESESDDNPSDEEGEDEEPAPFLPQSDTALSDLASTLEQIKLAAGTSDLDALRHVGFTKYLPVSAQAKLPPQQGKESVDLVQVMRETSILDANALDDRGYFKEKEEPGEHERDVEYHVRRLRAMREAQRQEEEEGESPSDEEGGSRLDSAEDRVEPEPQDEDDSKLSFMHGFVPGEPVEKKPQPPTKVLAKRRTYAEQSSHGHRSRRSHGAVKEAMKIRNPPTVHLRQKDRLKGQLRREKLDRAERAKRVGPPGDDDDDSDDDDGNYPPRDGRGCLPSFSRVSPWDEDEGEQLDE